MPRAILSLFIILMCSLQCFAQRTSGGLAVSTFNGPLDSLTKKMELSPDDTNKIDLLLKLSGIHNRKRLPANLDSSIFFAKKAYNLSSKLNFTKGITEALFLECKSFTFKDDLVSAKALLPLVYGEERVRLLLVIGEYYTFLPGEKKENLDRAYPYITHASQLSDSLNSTTWKYNSKMLFAKYWFEMGNMTNGKRYILQIIDDCRKRKDIKSEAFYWTEMQEYLPNTEKNYPEQKHSQEMAYRLYLQINDKKDALFALRDLASINIRYSHLDTAEKQLNEVFALFKELKVPMTFQTLYTASRLYFNKGELDRALYYEIKMLDLKDLNDRIRLYAWKGIGHIYYVDHMYKNSLLYTQKALNLSVKINEPEMYYLLDIIVNDQIKLGGSKKSLTFLQAFTNDHPPTVYWQKEIVAYLLGQIYNDLGQFDTAERYYLKMIQLDKQVQLQTKKIILYNYDNLGTLNAYKTIGKFYFERKKYRYARRYLEIAVATPKKVIGEIKEENEAELLLSKADSALGDYESAFKHFTKHAAINDSIFNVSKNRQLSELAVKYETTQKEQSIQLLQSKNKANLAYLRQLGQQRNFILGGTALLLIIAGLLYRQNQLRKKNNNTISQKNELLQKLVKEKELLLKEVHHRVKNNLHIVMSLLESQSAHLNNKAAITAIMDSQNRVRAIALIHQKLYGSANVVQVEMKDYVPELIKYLEESFNIAERKILIKYDVDQIRLDVSQAIPIGIILNEAITNAIKYAFDGQEGEISITMKEDERSRVFLSIADNGKGFPSDIDATNFTTLGMVLIKGLCSQLGGEFTIENHNGAKINIAFLRDESVHLNDYEIIGDLD